MAKPKKKKAKSIKPDDYFAAGPMEFARFGRLVIGRSRATQEQFEAAQARMAAQYPVIVGEIEDLVASIAARDRLCHLTACFNEAGGNILQ